MGDLWPSSRGGGCFLHVEYDNKLQLAFPVSLLERTQTTVARKVVDKFLPQSGTGPNQISQGKPKRSGRLRVTIKQEWKPSCSPTLPYSTLLLKMLVSQHSSDT